MIDIGDPIDYHFNELDSPCYVAVSDQIPIMNGRLCRIAWPLDKHPYREVEQKEFAIWVDPAFYKAGGFAKFPYCYSLN